MRGFATTYDSLYKIAKLESEPHLSTLADGSRFDVEALLQRLEALDGTKVLLAVVLLDDEEAPCATVGRMHADREVLHVLQLLRAVLMVL